MTSTWADVLQRLECERWSGPVPHRGRLADRPLHPDQIDTDGPTRELMAAEQRRRTLAAEVGPDLVLIQETAPARATRRRRDAA